MNDSYSKYALSFWVITPSSVCCLHEKNYKAFVSHPGTDSPKEGRTIKL